MDNCLAAAEEIPTSSSMHLLSIDKNQTEYNVINSRYPVAITHMEESFNKAIETENYREAIKYFKSFKALEIEEYIKDWKLLDLQFSK